MNESGWILIHKKLLQWEWYDDANTFRVFMHILLKANYEARQWHGVTIERGQHLTSSAIIAKELRLSRQNVRTSLANLQLTSEVTSRACSKYSILTVTKYNDYQPSNQQANQKLTSNQPATNHTIKEYKEIKKERTVYMSEDFDEFWKMFPKKQGKFEAQKAWSKLSLPERALVLERLPRHITKQDWQKDNGKYIPHASTWLNQRRWEDELEVDLEAQEREKFEKAKAAEEAIQRQYEIDNPSLF